MRKTCAIVALAGLASATLAQSYSIISHNYDNNTLQLINVPNSDPNLVNVQDLFTFADPDTRVLSIDRAPSGRFYFDNSPFPPTNPNEAGIMQIDNLFSAPNFSFLAQGDFRFSIGNVRFDEARNQIFSMQIPTSDHMDPRYFGVLAVDPVTGSITEVYEEDRNNPPNRPGWIRGVDLVKDINSQDYFALALNGGIFEDPNGPGDPIDRNFGSTLHRLSIDGNLDGTESLIVDLSDTSVTGLAEPITFARGIDINPNNGDIYVSDGEGSIFVVELDGNGDFAGITEIVSGLLAERPGGILYNEFNDKLLFNTARGDQIFQVDLDGSNLELVIDNFNGGGLYVIPAPGTLALLGLGGLAATRRRRA